jgi:hypothetical protein
MTERVARVSMEHANANLPVADGVAVWPPDGAISPAAEA